MSAKLDRGLPLITFNVNCIPVDMSVHKFNGAGLRNWLGKLATSVDISLTTQNMYQGVYGSIFGKRALLAIDHIMLALFWSYVPNMK